MSARLERRSYFSSPIERPDRKIIQEKEIHPKIQKLLIYQLKRKSIYYYFVIGIYVSCFVKTWKHWNWIMGLPRGYLSHRLLVLSCCPLAVCAGVGGGSQQQSCSFHFRPQPALRSLHGRPAPRSFSLGLSDLPTFSPSFSLVPLLFSLVPLSPCPHLVNDEAHALYHLSWLSGACSESTSASLRPKHCTCPVPSNFDSSGRPR